VINNVKEKTVILQLKSVQCWYSSINYEISKFHL